MSLICGHRIRDSVITINKRWSVWIYNESNPIRDFIGYLKTGEFLQCNCDESYCAIETLLKHQRSDVNEKLSNDRTILHEFIIYGTIEKIRLLLAHGADPNIISGIYQSDITMYDDSVLGVALKLNRVHHVINVLLDAGANPNYYTSNNKSPLDICIIRSKTDEIFILLRYGATAVMELSYTRDRQLVTYVFIVCDLMLYGLIQKDWTRDIKGFLY